MKLRIHHIDAFTNTVFEGNYAAVIVTENWLSHKLMQSIAEENNLSETAFIKRMDLEKFEIRWFSPFTEIDFCGHATLAAAFVLFEENSNLENLTLRAKTVGQLEIKRGKDGYIDMLFPDRSPVSIDNIPVELLKGLSIEPAEVFRNQQAYFAVYRNEEDVYSVKPNTEELKKLAPYDVVVTSKSQRYDFISRYFWPANGMTEDPVTGSIHAGLAPFWAKRLNRTTMTAFQASRRGGILKCSITRNGVIISGKAVRYLEGYIYV